MGSKFNNDIIKETLEKNNVFEKYNVKYIQDNDLCNHIAKKFPSLK